MKKLTLFLILLAAMFNGCINKEDASLRIALKKVYGTYDLVTYNVDSVDSLSLFKDSLSTILSFYYNDVDDRNSMSITGYRNDGRGIDLYWRWELKNDNTILKVISSGPEIGTGPFGKYQLPEWEIIRLTNNEMKLKTIFNVKEYYVELIEK